MWAARLNVALLFYNISPISLLIQQEIVHYSELLKACSWLCSPGWAWRGAPLSEPASLPSWCVERKDKPIGHQNQNIMYWIQEGFIGWKDFFKTSSTFQLVNSFISNLSLNLSKHQSKRSVWIYSICALKPQKHVWLNHQILKIQHLQLFSTYKQLGHNILGIKFRCLITK